MKNILFILAGLAALGFSACTKSDFEKAYPDPSKVSTTTISKQFAGMIYTNREYVVPSYWNYFVVLRTTANRYIQAVGWENAANQYVPGAASITDRWNNYYAFLAQYKEFLKVYGELDPEVQDEYKIYKIAATIYFYDHTQKVIDLHGDIPWSEAGMLSTTQDYLQSFAKYDDATAIYTTMLDTLKSYADQLNSITILSGVLTDFKNQDMINKGDLTLWKKYCNSLRLRMLTRVSGVSSFQSRSSSEIAAILGNVSTYPVVTSTSDMIKLSVVDLNTDINAKGFETGLEDWNGNIAGKVLIDHMKAGADPRLRAMFEPGANAGGVYNGLDPQKTATEQNSLIAGGTMAIYNRSTLSRNDYFPGILMTAAEVNFLAAEYYLKAGNNASAKTAYETGITRSVEYYYWLRTLSNDNTAGALTATNSTEIDAYINSSAVKWDNATTTVAKLGLIATEKWIHYSVVQPLESWAEIRRLDAPTFTFWTDNSNAQKQPPVRWVYPSSEATYNTANYEAVKTKDNLSTKIFWDLQ